MDIPNIKFKNQTLESEGIEIIDLHELFRRRLNLDHDPNNPHRVHFNLMLFIEEGAGTHFIDFDRYPFEKGSILFINKNQIHAFSLNSKTRGKAVIFSETFVERVQTNMNVSIFSPTHFSISYLPIFTPSSRLAKSCVSLLSEIRKEIERKNNSELIIMLLFSSLFGMLERDRPNSHTRKLNSAQIERFGDFTILLEKMFTKERDACYYSDKMHITYKTLNNLCKLATDKTAKQLIDAHTIIEAKRRLILDNKQIQEIACDLGFEEVSNFIKYFKKHTLLTPLQFKKMA